MANGFEKGWFLIWRIEKEIFPLIGHIEMVLTTDWIIELMREREKNCISLWTKSFEMASEKINLNIAFYFLIKIWITLTK